MSHISQENAASITAIPVDETSPQSFTPEPDADGWIIVSRPGAAVEISTRSMPDRIREAIARNVGIGTGTPREL